MEIKIEPQELLDQTCKFKVWSGPKLTRIFNRTGIAGYEIGPLGSAGFLKYKDRFFVVTASHVLTQVPPDKCLTDIILPYEYGAKTRVLTITKCAADCDSDIGIIEISPESAYLMESGKSKSFLDYSFIDEDPLGYFSKVSNVVFLHGITGQDTVIDYDRLRVEMTTIPYTTFIDRVDEASGRIVLLADKEGINEYGEHGHELPEFNGMSGSFAYSYRRDDKEDPFRLLGIVSNGSREAEFIWLIPINEVTDFIESTFFSS